MAQLDALLLPVEFFGLLDLRLILLRLALGKPFFLALDADLLRLALEGLPFQRPVLLTAECDLMYP